MTSSVRQKGCRDYVTVLGVLLVFIMLSRDVTAAGNAACAQEKLQGCMILATSLLEDSKLAFPSTRIEVENTCKSWTKLLNCMDGYVNDCMDERERGEFKQAVGGILEGVRRLCSDPEYQTQYFHHAECIKNTYTDDRLCGVYYSQLARQVSQDIDITALCCNLRKFESCVVSTTSANCGTTARDFVRALLEKTMGYLVQKCAKVQYLDQCSVGNDISTATTFPSSATGTSGFRGANSSSNFVSGSGWDTRSAPTAGTNSIGTNPGGDSAGAATAPTTRWSLTQGPERLMGKNSATYAASSSTISLLTGSVLTLILTLIL